MMGNFLEIKDLKKSFGTGEAKQEVLRGMALSLNIFTLFSNSVIIQKVTKSIGFKEVLSWLFVPNAVLR